jgi:hypothetical protein
LQLIFVTGNYVCVVATVAQDGNPAIVLAIKEQQRNIALKLIEMKADVNVTDEVCGFDVACPVSRVRYCTAVFERNLFHVRCDSTATQHWCLRSSTASWTLR